MSNLYTTREIADLLGVQGEWRVRRLFEDGTLNEPPRFGGKRAIPHAMIVEILDALRARGWLPSTMPSAEVEADTSPKKPSPPSARRLRGEAMPN